MPKSIKMYCPYCKKHTMHEVERVRKKKASEFKAGQRRFRRVTSGYGGFPQAKVRGQGKANQEAVPEVQV